MINSLNLDFVRNHFPSLERDFIFMDNAGGSQALKGITDRITDYFNNYNVQLGASYQVSYDAGKKLDQVANMLANYINARRKEEVIIGSSSTMLLRILSLTLSRQWDTGDEIIITNSDHEANVSCWTDLARMGIVIKIWKVNPETFEFDLDDLKALLSNKTKLVAMVHASNILGMINPVKQIAETVHQAGALFCVDGVAFAPHRQVDVQDLDVDFYVFSTYKVYGPHQAIMYGRYELLRELDSINHYFIGKEEVPYKLQPGNFNYELTYSLSAIPAYINSIYDFHNPKDTGVDGQKKVSNSFQLIAVHEERLADTLLDYLKTKSEVKIIGYPKGDLNKRVPTISFVHDRFKSNEVVEKIDQFGIGIRFGDFYAKKIIEDLNLAEKEGVIRVSLVHYNTVEEVDKLIAAFESIF